MSLHDLVTALSGARRAVQLYPATHPAFIEAIEVLVGEAVSSINGAALVLNVHQGRLYHESLVIPEDVPGAQSLAESFETRHIESITLEPGFDEKDAVGLVEVLALRPSQELDPEAELASRGVVNVTLGLLADDDVAEREERDRQRAADRALYGRLMHALRAVLRKMEDGGSLELVETASIVSQILERFEEDPSAVLALTTISGEDDKGIYHALNTTIYCSALGTRLGMPPTGLESLALSALLHDVGKTAFDATDPAQYEPMRQMHSEVGAEILQRLALEDPAPMLVAYEHHMNHDGSGYPDRASDYIAHPYSRMIAIANRYDNLTSPSSGAAALTPDRAIVEILGAANKLYDPFFARLFAGAMGVFPVGSMVRLTSHAVGIVVRPGEDPFAPTVRLIYDADGNEISDRPDLNLEMSDDRIVEVISPESLNVRIADKL